MEKTQASILFDEALKLASDNLFFDAAKIFTTLAEHYPDHELADDALYNAGLCHFHMNLFNEAIKIFKHSIDKYPDALINANTGRNEVGETAAKCHYSIINCYLGLNDIVAAKKELSEMAHYTAYILTDIGEKITFSYLAEKAIDTYSQIINADGEYHT